MRSTRSIPLVAGLGLLLVGLCGAPAFAGDGVLEINQTCAVETGCFPGDVAGFPVVISPAAGATSFRLTSDLVLAEGESQLPGIRIVAHGITVDLGGFAIMGAACVGLGANEDCKPESLGNSHGVESARITPFPEFWRGTVVRNGRVLGMRGEGIFLGPEGRVSEVEARWNSVGGVASIGRIHLSDVIAVENGLHGFLVGSGSIGSRLQSKNNDGEGFEGGENVSLDDIVATGNVGRGVLVAEGGSLRNVIAQANAGAGIECGNASSVHGSTARGNAGTGIVAGEFSTIQGSLAVSNDDDGLSCRNGCTLLDNTAYQNGDAAGDDGISCLNGCNVRRNTSRSNFENGLQLGVETGYRDNVLSNNTATAAVGGVNLGGNLCDGAICP